MNKLDKFMLDFVPKNSEINEFFTKTTLRWWNHVDLFTRSIYAVNPVITPQEVLNEYDQSLSKIINTKGINTSVVEHIKSFQKKMILAQTLKTIGLTLLDLRRQQAKKRKITTEITREDFQTAVENDRMNKKAEIFSDDYTREPDEVDDENFRSPYSSVTSPLQHDSHSQSQRPQISSPSDPSISEYEKVVPLYLLMFITPRTMTNHEMLEEAIDDQEVKKEINNKVEVVKENKKGPFRMSEENREEIAKAYRAMDTEYMWKLSSGRIVEEELFELGNDLEFEHAIHSFILDVEDELIMEHFTEEELEEISSAPIPEVPELSDEVNDFLCKFLGKINLNEIRQIIKESIFGDDYNREKHHDVDYICLALYSLVREIENGNLKDTNLENWYNCHVWNVIFDQAFGDIKAVAIVRGESTSISTATRKNKKTKRKLGERRKIGRRGDWIIRAVGNGNKDEFGAGEAGKDWIDKYGTKYLKEIGLKLPKTLKDMFVNLMERINWNEEMRRKIQTLGIIHRGLTMIMVYVDNPKGYICRFRRCDLMEVPDTVEKFDSVLTILASVLNAKSVVQQTIKVVQTGQTTKSFKSAGLRKRSQDENQHQLSACMSTPKKAKVYDKMNITRSYPASPCPESDSEHGSNITASTPKN
ncbi:hypothetical protein RhiirC2_772491 [Rhizophagus irregularis]|uniref:Uncharacterized protein n=1 Tax=Rhizophagus irregularis TaxID=588596 RepID=A0A2N1NRE4_9GLOM|nr:hypothetical protein RhiirC2_772491 [Rhizophagus irregularis]